MMKLLVRLLPLLCLFCTCLANGTDPCANPANLNQIINYRETADLIEHLSLSNVFNITDTSGCYVLENSVLVFSQNNRPRLGDVAFQVGWQARLFNVCPGSDPNPLLVSVRYLQNNTVNLEVNADDQTTNLAPFTARGELQLTNTTAVKQFNFVTKNSYVFSPSAKLSAQFQSDSIITFYFSEPNCLIRRRQTILQRTVYSPLIEFSLEILGGSTLHFSLPPQTAFLADYEQTKYFIEHCTCSVSF